MRLRDGAAIWITIAVVFAVSCAQAASPVSIPNDVSVCDLASNPMSFNGRKITVRAVLVSDLNHGHTLKDRNCESPYLRLRYRQPLSPTVQRFEEELHGDMFDQSLRVYVVRILGTFVVSEPDEVSRPSAKPPVGRILVDEILSSQKYTGPNWRAAPAAP